MDVLGADGSLNFTASINTTNFKEQLTDIKSEIKNTILESAKVEQSLETLRAKILARKDFLIQETDLTKIKQYNSEIQILQAEVNRLTNIGKTGFDSFGNPIKKELDTVSSAVENTTGKTNVLSKSFSFLRQAAYILPGVGIAGILNLIGAGVIALIKSFVDGDKALDDFKTKYNDLSKALDSGGFQDAVKNVEELKIQVDLAKKGFIDKKDVVEQYNKTIGETTGQVKTLAEVERKLIDDADAYIKMTLYKAAANVALEDAAKKAVEAEKVRLKNLQDFANSVVDARVSAGGAGGTGTGSFNAEEYDKETERIKAAEKKRQDEQIKIQTDAETQQVNIAKNFLQKAADISNKSKFDFQGDASKDLKDMQKAAKDAQSEEEKVNEILRERQGILDKLSSLERDSKQSGLLPSDNAVDQVQQKYEQAFQSISEFNKKIDEFNNKNKTNVQGIQQPQIDTLKAAESLEVLNTQYKEDAKNYIASLDDKKKAFDELKSIQEQGNDDVTAFAEQTYKKQLQGFTSYLDFLKSQLAGIQFEIAVNGSNVGLQQSLDALTKKIAAEQNNIAAQDAQQRIKLFHEAIAETNTYYNNLSAIDEKYNREKLLLSEKYSGQELADRLKNLEIDKQNAIDAAKDEAFKKTQIYQDLNQQIVKLNRQQTKSLIDGINELLSNPNISDDLRNKLQNQLNDLNKSLNFSGNQNYVKDLQTQLKKVNDELATGLYDTEQTHQNLLKQKQDYEDLLKAAKAQPYRDTANYLSSISQSLSDFASSIKDSNAGLSDTVNILSQATSKASDLFATTAAIFENPTDPSSYIKLLTDTLTNTAKGFNDLKNGSTASGLLHLYGPVTSFIGDLIDAGKANKTEADKQLLDYQNSLITGELQYNELLRQRARDQQDINNLTVQELQTREQMLALQKQQAQADFNNLLVQIQAQGQQITGEHTEKTGGIFGLFKKTQTVQDLAGLSGADFDQLEKLFTEGKLDENTSKWFQQLQQVHDELTSIGQTAQDVADALNQALTGTTSDDIANSIIQGFESGKTATADFADDFKSLMKSAILESLKYSALKQPLQDFYNQFAADAASDNILTQDEITDLQSKYNAIIGNASKQFQDLKNITGVDFSADGSTNPNTLQGAVKGISEQSAELLAGQFGAQRTTMMQLYQVGTEQLKQQILIANYCSDIPNVKGILRDMQTNGIKIR